MSQVVGLDTWEQSPELKKNGNHKITTQKHKRIIFLPHLDLKHGTLKLKASVLPMSYANPFHFTFNHFLPFALDKEVYKIAKDNRQSKKEHLPLALFL